MGDEPKQLPLFFTRDIDPKPVAGKMIDAVNKWRIEHGMPLLVEDRERAVGGEDCDWDSVLELDEAFDVRAYGQLLNEIEDARKRQTLDANRNEFIARAKEICATELTYLDSMLKRLA